MRLFVFLSGTILGIILSLPAMGQTCRIQGNLPGAEGREIYLTAPYDYLSGEIQTIQKQIIEKDGNFSFSFPLSEIMPISLSVNFYTATFFVAPGEQYILKGEKFSFDDFVNPFLMQPPLPLYLAQADPLNRFIAQFDKKSNRFETEKYRELLSSQNFTMLDDLYIPTDQLPEKYRRFCEDYQTFSIGSLKATYAKKRSQKLGTTYLSKQRPDTHNYCYMLFFNAFFTDYLPEHSHNLSLQNLQEAVNGQNLAKALDLLGNDPVLVDEDVRALFFVKLLKDYSFRRDAVIKLLKSIQSSSRFLQVKEAAQHVLEGKMHLAAGTSAPAFSLPDASSGMVSSENLKGKFLYVNFFKTNCYDCLSEMEFMRELYEKNKHYFEFVSICIDDKRASFESFSKNYQYPWKVVYAGYPYDFIQQWQAKTVPYYILIDQNYKILEVPAPSPEEGVQYMMEKISWETQRRERKSVKP